MEIGARVRRFRGVLGLTQAELAARLDVRQATVSAWESGQCPRDDSLVALAALAYTAATKWLRWLREGGPEPKPPKTPTPLAAERLVCMLAGDRRTLLPHICVALRDARQSYGKHEFLDLLADAARERKALTPDGQKFIEALHLLINAGGL